MQNMEIRIDGNRLTIEVDLTRELSTTGKGNVLVSTTGNWVKLDPFLSMNMVVVKKVR